MTICNDLREAVLQAAIQGKLTEQLPSDGNAFDLFEEIKVRREELIKNKQIKKKNTIDTIKAEDIPFDIPENWIWVRLSSIGEIIGGGTPKTSSEANWENATIPWITPADMRKYVKGKYISRGEKNISEIGLKTSSTQLMPANTIVYSSRAPIGYIAIAKNSLCTNQGFKSFVAYDTAICNYIYYCLIARTDDIIRRSSGTTFKEISGTEFGMTMVPLPPLTEQYRIVAKVDELMAKIDDLEKTENELETLKKDFPGDMKASILQAAMQGKLTKQLPSDGDADELLEAIKAEREELIKTKKIKSEKPFSLITEDEIPFDIPNNWRWATLEHISRFIGSKQNQIQEKDVLKEGKYPVISQSKETIIGYTNVLDKTLRLEKSVIVYGDHTALVKYVDFDFVIGADGVKVIEPICIEPKFLYYALMYNLLGIAAKGSYTRHYKYIKNKLIPIPPIEEQQRIVDKLDQLLPLCDILQEGVV